MNLQREGSPFMSDERRHPMTISLPFPEHLSERWLIERTYHAQLQTGRELSVHNFTEAMKTITHFYVPLSTWREIPREEAHASYQQGSPVLLYSENYWQHPNGACGIEYAVRYLDLTRGTFSNVCWRAWLASEAATIFDGCDLGTITFLGPCVQFPYTTHYTVIASDGQVHAYANHAEAIEGFHTFLPQKLNSGNHPPTAVFPQFCSYHEVTCPSGVYHLEFFGPRMYAQAYKVR